MWISGLFFCTTRGSGNRRGKTPVTGREKRNSKWINSWHCSLPIRNKKSLGSLVSWLIIAESCQWSLEHDSRLSVVQQKSWKSSSACVWAMLQIKIKTAAKPAKWLMAVFQDRKYVRMYVAVERDGGGWQKVQWFMLFSWAKFAGY